MKYRSPKRNTKSGSRPGTGQRAPLRSAIRKKPVQRLARQLFVGQNSAEHRCAKHYTQTVLNPFDTLAGACVPVLPCLDSSKRKVFARGTGMTQANGFGGIMASTTCVSDLPAVWYTTGAGSSNSMDGAGAATLSANNNSELQKLDFTDGNVQARIVGCGLRVRCISRPIDMNGRVFALEEPQHLNVNLFTIENVSAYDKVHSKSFDQEWTVVSWQPVLPGEQAYHQNPFASPTPTQYQPLCILIQGQGELPLSFEWEWVLHYEAIGSGARGKSESHIAPIAGPMAIAALQKTPTGAFDEVSNNRLSSGKVADQMISQGSSFDWSRLADTGMRVAQTAIGAITSRAASQYMVGGLAALAA